MKCPCMFSDKKKKKKKENTVKCGLLKFLPSILNIYAPILLFIFDISGNILWYDLFVSDCGREQYVTRWYAYRPLWCYVAMEICAGTYCCTSKYGIYPNIQRTCFNIASDKRLCLQPENSVIFFLLLQKNMPASVAQLDVPSDWRPGGRGFNPRRGRQYSFVEIDHEIFSSVILSLPLIQEGHLSVSGEECAQ